ncbi:MAG: hypothetical protein ACRYHA_21805, partial [Janthinobacterium lividum]
IAGVILSLIAYVILSVLGMAVGASLISPLTQQNPMHHFGFGSGVWVIVTTVIAVLVGSYFAGRCAPVLGWLHGLLAWAVMILVVAFGMTSLVGSAISAAGSVASTSATVASNDPSLTNNSTAASITQQVQSAVASAASEASSPQGEQDARQAGETAARSVARASWYSFAALIVGLIISIVSGSMGFRHQPPFEEGGGGALNDGDLANGRTRAVRTGDRVR